MLGIRYDPRSAGSASTGPTRRSSPRSSPAATTPASRMGIFVQTDMATPSLHAVRLRRAAPALPRAGDPRRDGRRDRRHRADAGSDVAGDQDPRRARRRRLGHQRQQDVHHQHLARRLPLPARRHRSRRRLRRLHADHRADRRAGRLVHAARQDRQLGLRHRRRLPRGRARAGRQHHRRARTRLPAADGAVPGRAPDRGAQLERRRRCSSGTRPTPTARSASSSASRSASSRSTSSSSSTC